MTELREGQYLYAVRTITEGGEGYPGSDDTKFPEPDYTHAKAGDRGRVEFVDDDGLATVRFERTGTATIVSFDEVEEGLDE